MPVSLVIGAKSGERVLIPEQTLTIPEGLVFVVGGNGSGKSLLLQALACPDRMGHGVTVSGDLRRFGDSGPGRRRILVQATDSFFLGSTVAAELMTTALLRGVERELLEQHFQSWTSSAPIGLDHRVSRLSRGQAQILALSLDGHSPPPMLLLDEPDAFLDDDRFADAARRLAEVAKLAECQQHNFVIATHRLEDWTKALQGVQHSVLRLGGTRTEGQPKMPAAPNWGSAPAPKHLGTIVAPETGKGVEDLWLKPGSFVFLYGQNASGKSTALKAIYRTMKQIHARTAFVPDWSADVGDSRTVGQSLVRAPNWQETLDCIGIRSDVMVSALSWGQRRLLTLLQAIESPASVLLADEPLCGLDSTYARFVVEIFRWVTDNGGMVLATTNRTSEAATFRAAGGQVLSILSGR